MNHASYTPNRISERAARCLKLLPIAALLACGAQQAFAQGNSCSGLLVENSTNKNLIPDNTCFGIAGMLGGELVVSKAPFTFPLAIAIPAPPIQNRLVNESPRKWGQYLFPEGQEPCRKDCTLIIDGGDVTTAIGSRSHSYSYHSPTNPGKAILQDGTVDKIFGGFADASWHDAAMGWPLFVWGNPSSDNTVIIEGGAVNNNVVGAFSAGHIATDNTVTLAGGEVGGSVYGGLTQRRPYDDGSYAVSDSVSGNTLVVKAKSYAVGGEVANFEKLAFHLPADIADGDTMLNVGGKASFPFDVVKDGASGADVTTPDITTVINADGKEISRDLLIPVSITVTGKPKLEEGAVITLIDAAGGLHINLDPESKTIDEGGYRFKLRVEDNKLIAEVCPLCNTDWIVDRSHTSSSPAMGDVGLLLSGLALAGAAAPALRRRERREQGKVRKHS